MKLEATGSPRLEPIECSLMLKLPCSGPRDLPFFNVTSRITLNSENVCLSTELKSQDDVGQTVGYCAPVL